MFAKFSIYFFNRNSCYDATKAKSFDYDLKAALKFPSSL